MIEQRRVVTALILVGLVHAIGSTPTAAQVHTWLLSDAGNAGDCEASVSLGSLDAQGEPFYQWAGQTLQCRHRMTITWTNTPASATSQWRMQPAAGGKNTTTHVGVAVQTVQGHQVINTSFDFWDAFLTKPGAQPYGSPTEGCKHHYHVFRQQGHDGKSLLANGFEYHHPATVSATLIYQAQGSSVNSNAGSNTAATTVRIRCGGNTAVAEKAYPTPVQPAPQRFQVSNPGITMYMGNSPTPFVGRVETTCPAQLRLVGTFDHSSNVPGTVQSRFRWTPGPTSTGMTTQVVHAPGSLNYTAPQVHLVVPIPLPTTVYPQPQPQGGGFVVQPQPQQGPQMVQGALPANEHKASVRFEITRPSSVASAPVEYHIVCTNQGTGPNMVVPQPQPPPGQPVITAPPAQPPPAQPPMAAQPPAAQPPTGAAAIAAAGSRGYEAFTYVLELPGAGAVGGFTQLGRPRGAGARAAAGQVTLAGGSLDASALQDALRRRASATLVRREAGRETCRIELQGVSVRSMRNETVANQAQLVLAARRIQDGCQ
jgi:hypothetical protein